ncbi:MAG: DUF721 domain-containing protein [Desulfuromonadales bacterium]|nr:DUF721 domain-containing protein [Desulfuromonadales bacterium]MBN2792741.1 DUF721 domain-containing protein [Desulfuromonadales bacterium]
MKKIQRPPMKKAESVGSLISAMMGQPGFGEQITRHQAWLIWDQLVGEQIAARARPRKIRRGILEVQVDHPVWMQQLHMLKPQILKKIHDRIPNAGITDIYLRQANSVHPHDLNTRRAAAEPPPWMKVELTALEKRMIEDDLKNIEDEELKQELRKLRTLQKQVNKSRES